MLEEHSLVSLDVLLTDLPDINDFEPKGDKSELKQLLGKFRSLKLSPDNRWQVVERDLNVSFNSLCRLVLNDNKLGDVISVEQKANLEQLAKEYSRNAGEAGRHYSDSLRDGDSQEIADKVFAQSKSKLDKKYFSKALDVVAIPNGESLVFNRLRVIRAKSRGLFGFLMIEKLDDGRVVSKSTRDRLKKFLSKKIKQLVAEMIIANEELIQEQIDDLPDEIRSQVRKALGEKPERLHPNASMLFNRVRNNMP